MKIIHKTLKLKSAKFLDFIDLTDEVETLVKTNRIKNGLVMIYSKHTTGAIRINEKEKGIVKDFRHFVTKLVPPDHYYHHNDLTERTENLVCEPGASDCLNGHSHILHLLMGATSETLSVIDGKLILGTWQRIFFIELDTGRPREVLIKIMSD